MCPDSSIRQEISVRTVQAPQWRSCVESGEDGLGDARLPDRGWVGRGRSRTGVSLRSSRAFCVELRARSREEERGITSSR